MIQTTSYVDGLVDFMLLESEDSPSSPLLRPCINRSDCSSEHSNNSPLTNDELRHPRMCGSDSWSIYQGGVHIFTDPLLPRLPRPSRFLPMTLKTYIIKYGSERQRLDWSIRCLGGRQAELLSSSTQCKQIISCVPGRLSGKPLLRQCRHRPGPMGLSPTPPSNETHRHQGGPAHSAHRAVCGLLHPPTIIRVYVAGEFNAKYFNSRILPTIKGDVLPALRYAFTINEL